MTPAEAVQILAQATEPQVAGQISRAGYAQIERALVLLGDLHPMQPTESAPLPEQGEDS